MSLLDLIGADPESISKTPNVSVNAPGSANTPGSANAPGSVKNNEPVNITDITVNYKSNDIKYAILNNVPIEAKLNVIIVISNPCLYKKRYILLNEFVKRIEEEEDNVNLFVVELVYGNQKFMVTDKNNKNHLQLTTTTPIWHKENMVNLGVKYLLPKDWKAFAWIDADVEFDNVTWATDTLKILNGYKDIVQIFSHAVDMDKNKYSMNIFSSFGFQYETGKSYIAPRQRGTIILFDSRTQHRVQKVKSGVRKSLVGWVVGNRWR